MGGLPPADAEPPPNPAATVQDAPPPEPSPTRGEGDPAAAAETPLPPQPVLAPELPPLDAQLEFAFAATELPPEIAPSERAGVTGDTGPRGHEGAHVPGAAHEQRASASGNEPVDPDSSSAASSAETLFEPAGASSLPGPTDPADSETVPQALTAEESHSAGDPRSPCLGEVSLPAIPDGDQALGLPVGEGSLASAVAPPEESEGEVDDGPPAHFEVAPRLHLAADVDAPSAGTISRKPGRPPDPVAAAEPVGEEPRSARGEASVRESEEPEPLESRSVAHERSGGIADALAMWAAASAPGEPSPLPRTVLRPSPPSAAETVIARALPSIATPRPPISPRVGALGARHLFARALRWLALAAAAIVLGVVALIALYRVVDPPFSALMVQRWLAGEAPAQAWVPLERISPQLVQAVLVSEDARFCQHFGIDLKEIGAALERAHDGVLRGASTISMQVAKNLFLWPAKSYVRKGIELPLTLGIELFWPKRRILEVYLNIAEWGPGVFGAEAAARQHFGKSAARLGEREAALLAVSLPDPHDRHAGAPGPGLSRLATTIQLRMRAAGNAAACVLPRKPKGPAPKL